MPDPSVGGNASGARAGEGIGGSGVLLCPSVWGNAPGAGAGGESGVLLCPSVCGNSSGAVAGGGGGVMPAPRADGSAFGGAGGYADPPNKSWPPSPCREAAGAAPGVAPAAGFCFVSAAESFAATPQAASQPSHVQFVA